MSRYALMQKLRKQAEQIKTDETVRQVSQVMDQCTADALGGEAEQPLSLEQLMEMPHGAEELQS